MKQIFFTLVLAGLALGLRPWSPVQDGLIGNIPRLRYLIQQHTEGTVVGVQEMPSGSNGKKLVRVFELPEGWSNCGSEQDIWQFDLMALSPNPPQRNHNATIRVAGNLLEAIAGGVKVDYLLKYGSLPIVKDVVDACELIKDYPDLPQCPLQAGKYDVSYEDLIPMATPMGKYSVHAEGYLPQEDGSKKPIFCVEGVVTIKLFNPETLRFVNSQEHALDWDN